MSARDEGRPFRDLDISYRPLELRRYIEQAQAARRTVRVGDVVLHRGGEQLALEVQISPLVDRASGVLGVTVVFQDVTESRRLQAELEAIHRRPETAYEELQSTNEELETMNEELQSTNDELQAINEELQDRTSQVDEADVFLEAILSGLRAGVVVLAPDMSVRVRNQEAHELWGLRPEETIGKHFLPSTSGYRWSSWRP